MISNFLQKKFNWFQTLNSSLGETEKIFCDKFSAILLESAVDARLQSVGPKDLIFNYTAELTMNRSGI